MYTCADTFTYLSIHPFWQLWVHTDYLQFKSNTIECILVFFLSIFITLFSDNEKICLFDQFSNLLVLQLAYLPFPLLHWVGPCVHTFSPYRSHWATAAVCSCGSPPYLSLVLTTSHTRIYPIPHPKGCLPIELHLMAFGLNCSGKKRNGRREKKKRNLKSTCN